MKSNSTTKINLFVEENFLDSGSCNRLLAGLKNSKGKPARIDMIGRSVLNPEERKVSRLSPRDSMIDSVKAWFVALKPVLASHFKRNLLGFESPQFLKYEVGDFYQIHSDTSRQKDVILRVKRRQVSAVLFLNAESTTPRKGKYSGGTLILHSRARVKRSRLFVRGKDGLLVAFRSSMLHEVTKVTSGERYTVVTWFF